MTTDPHANRWRGTLEEARAYANKPKGLLSISHVLDNGDGTYSVMSHINCEWCDYCSESNRLSFDPDKKHDGIHNYKEDPYEEQKRLDDDAEQARDAERAAARRRAEEGGDHLGDR